MLCDILLFIVLVLALEGLSIKQESESVLVLGSNGLIGRELVRSLTESGYHVVQVQGRDHVDLRDKTAFNTWISSLEQSKPIAFAFFLACEVGGSKFLYGNAQLDIITSNVLMYQVLFPWFESNSIPFIFTSTSLHSQESSYGSVKRLGEQWINSLGIGKSVRLWNVFGEETFGIKSRVITDWIMSCLEKGEINSLTDGTEKRQFMYSRDCTDALVRMMEMYTDLDQITDLSSFEWITMHELAHKVAKLSPRQCSLNFSLTQSRVPQPDTPNPNSAFHSSGWSPKWSLDSAISHLFNVYGQRCPCSPPENAKPQCNELSLEHVQ